MSRLPASLQVLGVISLLVCLGLLYTYLNTLPQTGRKLRVRPKYTYASEQQPEHAEVGGALLTTPKSSLHPASSPRSSPSQTGASPRMAKYCDPPFTGQEGEAPPGYQLEAVTTVIRHGDRSPVYSLYNYPTPKLSCLSEKQLFQENSKFQSFLPTMWSYRGREHGTSKFKQWMLYPSSSVCDSGQMTGYGSLQHLKIGKHLANTYLHKWQLFGEEFSADQVYVSSTEFSRTYQSAVAFLFGFLPTFNLTELYIEQTRSMVFCSDQYSGLTCHCPVLQDLKVSADRNSGLLLRNDSRYTAMRSQLANTLDVKVGKLRHLFALVDALSAYSCHKLALPCGPTKCITPDMIEDIWGFLDKSEKEKYKTDLFQQFIHLSLHSLLLRISDHFNNLLRGRTKVRFSLFSGHDHTVNFLSGVLGINKGVWPSFASRVIIELYSKNAGNRRKHFFLRFLFNGKDLTSKTSFCENDLVNGMCKLEALERFIKTHLLQNGIHDISLLCNQGNRSL
ncbi:hypothetical protein ScPMuIL_008094 [Solemya velum]